uniref:RING-type domain-containing protein n=1 Tax=Hyaloperonospora arabidopsidis (strain Emoy2) TaxID=559515 RepID=M4B8U9_HYAAE
MEKMILKNVAASRNSTKNRAQQIVEALKKKRLLEAEEEDAAVDQAERALKKKKTEPTLSSSPPSSTDVSARTALAAGILSPARHSKPQAAPVAAFVSPSRRPAPLLQSPTLLSASPARSQGTVKPLHLSSPVRPPRSSVFLASPARLKPRGAGIAASPLRRRQELLTSPLRRGGVAAPSPKRPLVFDDAAVETGRVMRTGGQPPLLCAALEQVEVETAVTTTLTMKSGSKLTAKSPFQSFQAKVRQSPAKLARTMTSPGCEHGRDSQLTRTEAMSVRPRAGPMLVDLTHSGGAVASDARATTSTGAVMESGSGGAAPVGRSSSVSTCVSKPMRKFLSSTTRPVVAQRSICFSTEGVATALDVTPDGEIIVVGFIDGSVRLYEMDSSVPSDRHGYLLGHIDEQSAQGSSSAHLRVKISPDGRYVFVGCRQGPRVVMSINLDHYRNEKDGDDDNFEQCHKHFHSNGKLRGFADVTTYVPQANSPHREQQESRDKRSAYYILTGLGVGNLNLWRFVEPELKQEEPIWQHLQNFSAGGNTATAAAFLASSISSGTLAIAAVCKDKNVRVWPLEFMKQSPSSTGKSNDECAAEPDDIGSFEGNHAVTSHFNIPNTSDVIAIHGQYAYGISLMGEAYRIYFPDSSNLNSSSLEQAPRQEFELEKIGGGGGSTSRRSNIMLESLSASDDGKAIIAVSTEGIFYYSNKLPDVGSSGVAGLCIIGKNASENALFKTPMKVYTPLVTMKGTKVQSEAMMAVVTNPSSEDSENEDGYINVDLTEVFAARWMVPSRGNSCWVCGVRNTRHWVGPPESKTIEPARAQLLAAERKDLLKAQRRRQRALKRAKDAAGKQKERCHTNGQQTPTSAKTKTKTAPLMSAKKASVQKHSDVRPSSSADGSPEAAESSLSSVRENGGVDNEDDEDCTGSDDNTPSVASLISELEHFKKRNAEIKTEWQRRLQGERQLRRKWKQREEEFLDQLNDSLTKLDAAEVEGDRLRVLLRDAEKRFAFEKACTEQENSVKARYEQLCEHMSDKLALVVDQKRLLEQTTRSLLAEVDRNVHALKNAVILEKSECVVCKDQQAVTAVVPCGHLCFCETDAETYRRSCTSKYPTCPMCQQEIISLLRIYT